MKQYLIGMVGGLLVGVAVAAVMMPPRVIAAPAPEPKSCERVIYI